MHKDRNPTEALETLRDLLPESTRWLGFTVAFAMVVTLVGLLVVGAPPAAVLVSLTDAAVLAVLASPRFRPAWARLSGPIAVLGVAALTAIAGPATGFTSFLALVLVQEAVLNRPRRVVAMYLVCAAVLVGPVVVVGSTDGGWSRVAVELGVWALLAGAGAGGIRQLRRTTTAVRTSEARFRLLAETAQVGIYTVSVDPAPSFEYVNAAFVEMTGIPAAEWFRDPTCGRRRIHPDDLDAFLERRLTDLEDRPSPLSYRWMHPDGDVRWHEVLEVPVRDATGRVIGLQGVVTDVTARVREQQRTAAALAREHEAVARLERLHELKTTFLQSVSHELRTPLTSVLGFSRTLRDHGPRLDPAQQQDLLGRVVANSEKLRRLLTDLLDVDRLSRGAATLSRAPYELAELVGRVVDELESGRGRLVVAVDPAVAELDGPKVERIVENLIHNALRHTPPGSPIRVSATADAGCVEIVVADRGPGVPDDLKERLFEPFEQGAASATSPRPGTGIGLTLVARFSELHGGTATIEDRPGGGALFRVRLPAVVRAVGGSAEAHQEVALLPHP